MPENNIVSVFAGVKPAPIGEIDWMTVLQNIQSDKYRVEIEKVRSLSDPVERRQQKTRLPAVTFGGNFSGRRNMENCLSPTGFLTIDIDHVENIEPIFSSLSQDEHIWFIFRSPSGDGLKCAVRAEGIKTDDDIKKLYAASERYLSETYNVKIDPTSKDISRLTFVSWDPQLFINPNPFYFQFEKWLKPTEQKFYVPPEQNNGGRAKYGQEVLSSCCQEISSSAAGNQHNTRLRMARLVGGYIASGLIEESQALSELENAVKASGAKLVHQAMDTILDGINYGKQAPLQPKERDPIRKKDDIQYYCDPDEAFIETHPHVDVVDIVDVVDSDDKCGQVWTSCGHLVDSVKSDITEKTSKTPFNLASEIKNWIENSTGCFTCEQIDREFGLNSRVEKKNRSTILARAISTKLIKKDRNIPGKFQIIDRAIDEIDIFNTDIETFDMVMPFDLHRYCQIPKKGIIMVAGSFDSGKTALIMNILMANLKKPFQTAYLSSEMGGPEIRIRLNKFKNLNLEDLRGVKFVSRSTDQGSYIESHNPDGLTLIDYLEEDSGEYFKLPSLIRGIFDSLNDGIAVVGIQKHTESDYGRGGQGTVEKARLSLTVDKIGLVGDDLVSAVKVIKIKNWIRKNLSYHELHFKIKNGSEIEPISDWMPCSTVNRKLCLAQYQTVATSKNHERKKEQMDGWMFTFKTTSGKLVGIDFETFEAWQETYSNLDLSKSLTRISESTMKSGWLKEKWIFQIIGMLEKENEKAKKNG